MIFKKKIILLYYIKLFHVITAPWTLKGSRNLRAVLSYLRLVFANYVIKVFILGPIKARYIFSG